MLCSISPSNWPSLLYVIVSGTMTASVIGASVNVTDLEAALVSLSNRWKVISGLSTSRSSMPIVHAPFSSVYWLMTELSRATSRLALPRFEPAAYFT